MAKYIVFSNSQGIEFIGELIFPEKEEDIKDRFKVKNVSMNVIVPDEGNKSNIKFRNMSSPIGPSGVINPFMEYWVPVNSLLYYSTDIPPLVIDLYIKTIEKIKTQSNKEKT